MPRAPPLVAVGGWLASILKAEASLTASHEACSRALEEAREADRRREAAKKRAWELQAWSAILDQ